VVTAVKMALGGVAAEAHSVWVSVLNFIELHASNSISARHV